MALQSNETYKNILVSYHYLRKNLKFADYCFQLHKDGVINLMIDSGAFSVFQNKKEKEIKVNDYCSFLKDYHECCEKYVMLDVIGNQKKTEYNYKKMIDLGLKPMYVATMIDKKLSLLNEAVQINQHICVAGGYTTKSDWIKKRFQDIYNITEGKSLIHGLAYVNYKDMFSLPLHSVDSSSWMSGARYGTINYFNSHLGMKGMSRVDLIKGTKVIPEKMKEMFIENGIKPKHLKEKKYSSGNRSSMFFSSVLSNVDYQKYSKRKGVNYFLACAGENFLRSYLNYTNNNGINYEEWRDL